MPGRLQILNQGFKPETQDLSSEAACQLQAESLHESLQARRKLRCEQIISVDSCHGPQLFHHTAFHTWTLSCAFFLSISWVRPILYLDLAVYYPNTFG